VTDVPAELVRDLAGVRELDRRVAEMQRQVDADCLAALEEAAAAAPAPVPGAPPPARRRAAFRTADPARERRIEATMDAIVRLSEEKVARAQQAYDAIDRYVQKLDKDMASFEADVAVERERMGFPPGGPPGANGGVGAPGAGRGGASGAVGAGAPPAQSDAELYAAALAASDPSEPRYCRCGRISFGEMIACEHSDCPHGEWFHFSCVGLDARSRPRGEWHCSAECKAASKARGR
jgi:hypothetical protein